MMKTIFIAFGTIAMIAAATFAVLTLFQVDFGGGTSAEDDPVTRTGNLLRTTNRDAVETCIDFVNVDQDSAAAMAAVDNLESALSEALSDTLWAEQGLSDVETKLDVGCPSPPPPARSGVTNPIDWIEAPSVDVPSRYLLFVFVMSDEEAALFVGRNSVPITTQEVTCREDNCVDVTTGMYLGLTEASDSSRVGTLVRYALGLERIPDTFGS